MRSQFLLFVVSFFTVVTCATFRNDKNLGTEVEKRKSTKTPASIEAQQIAGILESSFVTEFSYPVGDSKLSPGAKQSILALLKRAKSKGEIAAAKVISWGDRAYPDDDENRLRHQQIKLVDDRNDNVESFLETLTPDLRLDKISMAERPGVMDDLLSSENARIKKSLEELNAQNKITKTILMFVLEGSEN